MALFVLRSRRDSSRSSAKLPCEKLIVYSLNPLLTAHFLVILYTDTKNTERLKPNGLLDDSGIESAVMPTTVLKSDLSKP